MCRIAAWIGRNRPLEDVFVTPAHSLLEQSQNAREAKLSVNGDGFGFGWYDEDRPDPGIYRDVLPAWSDANLLSLCRMIRSRLFVAHVRASTMGETARNNCHPFSFGPWVFCHNGQIPAFPQIRRTLEASLPDHLYEARQGSTDSEMLFLMLLANGLDDDPGTAFRNTFDAIRPAIAAAPNRATIVVSDGTDLIACRHSTDGRAPSLYCQSGSDGTILASEPLDGDPSSWTRLAQEELVRISADGTIQTTPLSLPDAA